MAMCQSVSIVTSEPGRLPKIVGRKVHDDAMLLLQARGDVPAGAASRWLQDLSEASVERGGLDSIVEQLVGEISAGSTTIAERPTSMRDVPVFSETIDDHLGVSVTVSCWSVVKALESHCLIDLSWDGRELPPASRLRWGW